MPRKGSPPRLRFPAGEAFDESLSKSAFARFLKCDPSRITQMVKAGTIAPPAVTTTGDILPALALAQMQEAGCFAPQVAAKVGATAPGATVTIPNETYDQARTRLTSGQADTVAMKNATRRAELIEWPVAVREFESDLSVVRTRLLAIPSEHAARLARITNPHEMQAALYDIIVEALEQLSDPEKYARLAAEIARRRDDDRPAPPEGD